MGRKIWAFVAFNLYAQFLISAFAVNTGYLFNASLMRDLNTIGMDFDPRVWVWENHYIWRLFAAIVVTAVAGFLAGAIAKSKGALVAAISNIPSVLFWIVLIYIFEFSDGLALPEKKTAFVIISIIAIPLTTYIAFKAGGFGEKIQKEGFGEDTVLGVKPYHWIWAILPIYWYALGIIYVTTKLIAFQIANWGSLSTIIEGILSLLAVLPVLVWGYPLLLVYRVLTGEILSEKNNFIRGMANFAILILGMGIATGVQVGSYWLLVKMGS